MFSLRHQLNLLREKSTIRLIFSGSLILLVPLVFTLAKTYTNYSYFKSAHRSHQANVIRITRLEGALSGIESQFRYVLLSGNVAAMEKVKAERNHFFLLLDTLGSDRTMLGMTAGLRLLAAEKFACQDSVANFFRAHAATNPLASPELRRFYNEESRLIQTANEIRALLRQTAASQQTLFLKFRGRQDHAQDLILGLVLAIGLLLFSSLLLMLLLALRHLNRRSQEKHLLHTLMTSTYDGFIILDAGQQVLLINENARAYMEACSGKKMSTGQQFLQQLPVPQKDTLSAALGQLENEAVVTVEEKHTRDGHVHILQFSFQSIQVNGNAGGSGTSILIRDITEKKAAEQERTEFFERMHIVNGLVQLGTWQFDLAADEMLFDEVGTRMLEVPAGTRANAEARRSLIHPEDLGLVDAAMMQLATEKDEVEMHFRIITPTGKLKHLYQKAIKRFHENGEVKDMIGGMIDITITKKAEARFRQVVNASPNALVLMNREGMVLMGSRQATQLLGYSEAELTGTRVEAFIPERSAGSHKRFIQQLLEAPNTWNLRTANELFARNKEGKVFPVEIGLSPLELDGEALVLASVVDISERKAAEADRQELLARFELAAETILLGILDANLDTGELEGDARLKQILQVPESAQLNWKAWLRQVHPDDRKSLMALLQKDIPAHQLIHTEWRQVQPGAEVRYFETKARAIWKDGKPRRIIAATVDISERVRRRLDLEAAKTRAEKSEQLQEQFLANMSHEIRTPLNGIVGMADLMGGTPLSPHQHQFLQVIQRSSQSLLAIINDVLDLSKIKSGKFTIENAPFNLHQVLQSAFEMLQLKAAQKGLAYNLSIDPAVPAHVRGDAGRLSQVLVNLLGNAVKFTREGTVDLMVQTTGIEENRAFLEFRVMDTGIGIEADALNDVFNSFAQANREVSIEFGGTGLGLTISRQLVEMQGGRIAAVSTPGMGSAFSVFQAFEMVEANTVQKSITIALADAGRYAGKRVLVAEDNEVNRMVIRQYLSKAGLHCTMAHDGKEACDILTTESFDLVILDLRMPRKNGFEVAVFIRQELRLNVPVMALTASALRSEKKHCLDLGMNAYMVKPFKAAELYETIFNLLDGNLQPGGSTRQEVETATPEKALYDLSELKMLGEKEFAIGIINQFKSDGRHTIGEIASAIGQASADGVFERAHRMKSGAGMLGAQHLLALLQQLENAARQKPADNGLLYDLCIDLEQHFGRVCKALDGAIPEVETW